MTETDPRLLTLARRVRDLEAAGRHSNAAEIERLCMEAVRLANTEGLAVEHALYQYFDDFDILLKDAGYGAYQTDKIKSLL